MCDYDKYNDAFNEENNVDDFELYDLYEEEQYNYKYYNEDA